MKSFVVKITKTLKIYNFLKKFNIVLQSMMGLGHGHNLFLYLIKKRIRDNKFSYFLEIGSTREQIYGQGSTEIIAKYCEKNKINFVSVDVDNRNVERLRKKLSHLKYFKSVCDKGENYLRITNKKFDCIYLDAFDIERSVKNKSRDNFYLKEYGSSITNEKSEMIHLEIVKNLEKKLNDKSIIVFDDTFINKNLYIGKGGKAIPYLLSLGFKIISKNSNSIALERFN
jgi:hypothetical protein